MRAGQGLENMFRQMPHDRGRDPVAGQVVGVAVLAGQDIAVLQPHQTRRLARRDQARTDATPLDHQDDLTTGAARGGAQTAGHVVKADLGALDLGAGLVDAGPAIDAPDHAAPGALGGGDLGQMDGRHHVEQLLRLGLRVPTRWSGGLR